MKEILKVCTKCKTEYPATTDYFYKQNSSPDGLTYSCRSCRKSSDAAVYLKNKALYIQRATERQKRIKKT